MAGPLTGIGGIKPAEIIRPAAAESSSGEFRSLLAGAIQRVEKFQTDASQSVDRYLSGDGEELHTAALATQRAELALDLFLQTRNKVVSAYQEIMRMQM
ncbi:MAG TPA: flagellar hook-basal body complex protein FliE [Tepidisphaeraceae bacterium]|nr:flagellar hook-basal body complex protein FliE [Tepidisphaeraceae bacterium]